MYEFIDINEQETTTALPAEAVSINGKYLENIVEGYRTLYTKGRESLPTELDTYKVGSADGERVKGRRYPARTLTVGFQLIADTPEEFRQSFNQLNNLLSAEESDFVFNDEKDKYFTGRAIMNAQVEAGTNSVKGEWSIYCAYPFKRSKAVRIVSSEDASGVTIDGNKAIFDIAYGGSYPARPLLRATFASNATSGDYTKNGDCGFVAYIDDFGNIIQLGNPAVTDLTETAKNDTLINVAFDTLTNWYASGLTIQTLSDPYWNKGNGQTQKYATGTGSLYRTVGNAVDFELNTVHRLAINATAETGTFKASVKNGAEVVAGFEIVKTGNGSTAQVRYILNDTIVGTDNIDVSYYNTNFGYCKRTDVYTQQTSMKWVAVTNGREHWRELRRLMRVTRDVLTGYTYTQSNLNSRIVKNAGVVTFMVGNLPSRTFKLSEVATMVSNTVEYVMSGNFNTNAVRSCAFIRKAGVPFAQIPNVFTAGDIVEADCNSANVYLYRNGSMDGALTPQYGALGNDWENFMIRQGSNQIAVTWSDWVNANYKPKIEILFNEVNI